MRWRPRTCDRGSRAFVLASSAGGAFVLASSAGGAFVLASSAGGAFVLRSCSLLQRWSEGDARAPTLQKSTQTGFVSPPRNIHVALRGGAATRLQTRVLLGPGPGEISTPAVVLRVAVAVREHAQKIRREARVRGLIHPCFFWGRGLRRRVFSPPRSRRAPRDRPRRLMRARRRVRCARAADDATSLSWKRAAFRTERLSTRLRRRRARRAAPAT